MLQIKSILLLLVFFLSVFSCTKRENDSVKPKVKQEYKTKVVKLNDQIHFIWIPFIAVLDSKETLGASIDKAALRKKFPNPPLAELGWVALQFLVPESSGLSDPAKYINQDGNSREPNLVHVYIKSREDWQLKQIPPVRSLHEDRFAGRSLNIDWMGMKCADRGNNFDCGIEIRPNEWAWVDVEKESLRKDSYSPQISVFYNSDAYGGVGIKWSVDAMHVAKIREIDKKLWEMIAKLNLLEDQ